MDEGTESSSLVLGTAISVAVCFTRGPIGADPIAEISALQLLHPGSSAGSRTARLKGTERRLSHIGVLQQAHRECTAGPSSRETILQTCCMDN